MFNKVIIIGKPNVGKSSLFNAIVKKKISIVDNYEGLTRDLIGQRVDFLERSYILYDSAGLRKPENKLEELVQKNTFGRLKECEIILIVFDGKENVTIDDQTIIKRIRKLNKKVILVINKAEGRINEDTVDECENFGLGEPIIVSASHNQGIGQLKLEINKNLSNVSKVELSNKKHTLAIVGKTNSGKSTIFNAITGRVLALTGNNPRLTRDPIETNINFKNLSFKVFDTAGFSKSSKNKSGINKLALNETARKIRLCQFMLIVMDINDYYERIHSKIIDLVYGENRCMILVINKIDSYKNYPKEAIIKKIYELNPQVKNLPIHFISALKKQGLTNLAKGIISQFSIWQKKISTSLLNSWLEEVIKEKAPPLRNGKLLKLKYIVQINVAPPKFNIFSNYPSSIPEHYKKYLINRLKKRFEMNGLPLKVIFKKTPNPYGKN